MSLTQSTSNSVKFSTYTPFLISSRSCTLKKVSKYHGVMLKGHVNLKQQHKSLLGDLWQKDQEDL